MELPADLDISITDIVILGRCRKMRDWFREQGLEPEFRALVKGGTVKSGVLLATGDPRADQVVRYRLEHPEAPADG